MIRSVVEAAVLLIVICFLYSVAHATEARRVFATPPGTTCETVKQYYAMLGGMTGVKAYAKANNVTLSPSQMRQAIRCLRM